MTVYSSIIVLQKTNKLHVKEYIYIYIKDLPSGSNESKQKDFQIKQYEITEKKKEMMKED